jgi:hypothetical protein
MRLVAAAGFFLCAQIFKISSRAAGMMTISSDSDKELSEIENAPSLCRYISPNRTPHAPAARASCRFAAGALCHAVGVGLVSASAGPPGP